MKRLSFILLWIAGLNIACSTHFVEHQRDKNEPTETTQTRLLITVESGRNERLLGAPSRIFSYQGKYSRSVRAKNKLSQLSKDYDLISYDAWPIQSLGVHCQVFTTATENEEQLLTRLQADPRVDSVQIMNRFYTDADTASPEPGPQHKPGKAPSSNITQSARPELTQAQEKVLSRSKDYAHLQDNLLALNVLNAHKFSTGKNVTVAIVDTHIDRSHRDLTGRVARQLNSLAKPTSSADHHGTAVAGIIAANSQDQYGITGIAPNADVLAITACWPMPDAAGECNSFTLARALDIAIVEQSDVINLSLSGPPDALLKRILESAINQNIIVAGAYKSAQKSSFPTYVEGVLAVSVNQHGPTVIQLPGINVLTTVPDDRYDFVSGNSMATAQLSGIAALALELDPGLMAHRLQELFNQTHADKQPADACEIVSLLSEQVSCTPR